MSIIIPKVATRQHIGFIGTTGSGKTQGMMQIFEAFFHSKKIIIDVKGDYVSTFKKEDDLIFCPLDERTIKWNIFNDIETYQDVANIALSLIPENPKVSDQYFDRAARSVLEGVLIGLSKMQKPSNKMIWETITSPKNIIEIMKTDDEAKQKMEAHIDDGLDKQTRGIIGTILANAGGALEALANMDGDFSFKKWTQNEINKKSIFLLGEERILDSMLPLYRLVVEIVAGELLSMLDDENRELFFWLDELPRLKKLHKVIDLMTLARSKGGKVVYSVQTIKQLEEQYKREGMVTILDTTNTKFIYRTSDAQDLEKILGQQEVLEYTESRSWGPNDMRDGGGHTKPKKIKYVVLASEIQNLRPLEFYVKSIAPYVTKARLEYIGRDPKCLKFVPNIRKIKKAGDFYKNLVKLTPVNSEKIDFEEFL
ncbi:MAG: type IV secretion system DNA-binding domain-containing protein [Sulfurospirillaceae bacterium]|nr:type IV secretion system DNA-binding domain-containing protein [Sulfurospirillaceae bacterium]